MNGEFRQAFRAGVAGFNEDLQVVAAQGNPASHQKLDDQRQKLYAAYQASTAQGDASAAERVIAAVTKARENSSSEKNTITTGREKWLKREGDFDAMLVKITELEDAGHPKAESFRKLGDAIQGRANDREYEQASTALDQLLPKLEGESTTGQPNLLSFGETSARADSRIANVQLHEEGEPDNVKLPDATQGDPVVTMIVRESGDKFEMKRSQIVNESRYVDNAAKRMWAKPADLISLEVKTMNFSGSYGNFAIDMDDIQLDMPQLAMKFEMRGGIVYPINKQGDVAFDKVNTPQIVLYKRWVLQEIEQRRAIREKITTAGFMFTIAIAQLAGAVGPPKLPKGPSPASMKLPNTKAPIRPAKPPQNPAPKAPKAPAQPNPAVAEAEVIATYKSNPSTINHTMSSSAHTEAWIALGNKPPAPMAFRFGDKIRVDVQRWPQSKLGDIGIKMRDKPLTVSRQGGTGPKSPELELGSTQPAPAPANPKAGTVPGAPPAPSPKTSGSPGTAGTQQPGKTGGSTNVSKPVVRTPGPQGVEVSPDRVQKMAAAGSEVYASSSSATHKQAWNALGRDGDGPVAFMVDKQVYVDMSRWPKTVPPPALKMPRGAVKVNPAKVGNK